MQRMTISSGQAFRRPGQSNARCLRLSNIHRFLSNSYRRNHEPRLRAEIGGICSHFRVSVGKPPRKATGNPLVTIDSESIIIRSEVAEANRPAPASGSIETEQGAGATGAGGEGVQPATQPGTGATDGDTPTPTPEPLPKRFQGTVMLSADRPARDMHQILEAIVEQLTTLQGADVSLKLEIDAEVSSGLDRSKVRTLLENATTLDFIDKSIN
jgi:hypothetical protein